MQLVQALVPEITRHLFVLFVQQFGRQTSIVFTREALFDQRKHAATTVLNLQGYRANPLPISPSINASSNRLSKQESRQISPSTTYERLLKVGLYKRNKLVLPKGHLTLTTSTMVLIYLLCSYVTLRFFHIFNENKNTNSEKP